MENPPTEPKSAPLRLPKADEMPELPLFAPTSPTLAPTAPLRTGVAGNSGFQMKLVQPSRWKRPSAWILPLMLVLSVVAFLVWKFRPIDPYPPADPRLPTVVIDAGHGGHDTEATGNGLREKDLTLDTALRLERLLRQRGFAVVLTRRDDTFLPLFDRSAIANRIPSALFVSIHYNDNSTAAGEGVETFYAVEKANWLLASYGGSGVSSDCSSFAQCVQSSMVHTLAVVDRGIKARQLAVVRYARCPAILVEGGFINNPVEAHKLAQPAYREQIALSVADGISHYRQHCEQAARERHLAGR